MTASRTLVPGLTGFAEDRLRYGILRSYSGIPKVTGPGLGLDSVGRSDCALFGDRMTVMLALSPVLFRGKENMTVQERVKFIGLIWAFFVGCSVSSFSWVPERRVFLSVCSVFGTEILHPFSPLPPGPRWNWSSPR